MTEILNLEGLTQDDVQKVKNFISKLKRARNKPAGQKLSLNWAGALKDTYKNTNALDLQHKILEWR